MATGIVVQVEDMYRSMVNPNLWFRITATDGKSYFCKWRGSAVYYSIRFGSLVKLTKLDKLLMDEYDFYKAEVLDGRT